jgi:hypothetical protein
VFTEYFWDMSWCDPCAADPLSAQELKNLGAEWVGGDTRQGARVMVTRLHVRYTPDTFPEDLAFQETADRQNFQTRYVLQHPAQIAPEACPAAAPYLKTVLERKKKSRRRLPRSRLGHRRDPREERPRPEGRRILAARLEEAARRRAADLEVAAMLAALRLPQDARLFQIAFQAILLALGVLVRDFSLAASQMALCFAAGLATQALWIRALGLRNVGYLSAIITCLGLSLLLRADSWWIHPLAAALALSAKFTLRLRGKHLFNPAMLGVVLAVLLLPGAWISPGQWGSDLALAAWFIALGDSSRVARSAPTRAGCSSPPICC